MPAAAALPGLSREIVDEPVLPPEAESEEDVGAIAAEHVRSAVVFSTDWTAETILSQLRKRAIDLNPAFQRRDAWSIQRKSRFIESIMLGFPVPQIVLAEGSGGKGSFIVIDGKQRLLSLQQFAGLSTLPGAEPLRLKGLDIRKDLNGKSYSDLSESKDLGQFENQTIRTVVVRNWEDERVLYQIFYRLNSNSVPLSPQELRQALIPGPFLKFAAERSANSKQLQRIWNRDSPDFRMRDVELFVRHFAFWINLGEYRGNLREFLDKACRDLNRDWDARRSEIESRADGLDSAIDLTYEIFDSSAFQAWAGGDYRDALIERFSTS